MMFEESEYNGKPFGRAHFIGSGLLVTQAQAGFVQGVSGGLSEATVCEAIDSKEQDVWVRFGHLVPAYVTGAVYVLETGPENRDKLFKYIQSAYVYGYYSQQASCRGNLTLLYIRMMFEESEYNGKPFGRVHLSQAIEQKLEIRLVDHARLRGRGCAGQEIHASGELPELRSAELARPADACLVALGSVELHEQEVHADVELALRRRAAEHHQRLDLPGEERRDLRDALELRLGADAAFDEQARADAAQRAPPWCPRAAEGAPAPRSAWGEARR